MPTASVMSDFLTAYRAALVTAGFAKVPASMLRMDDVPVSNINKAFRLFLVADGLSEQAYGGASTTSLQEITAEIALEIHWMPQMDALTVENTIADDLKTALTVMLKASNRSASPLSTLTGGQGVRRVWMEPGQHAFREVKRTPNEIVQRGTFAVRYLETRDLS